MNDLEKYPLAMETDPDFDKPHPYCKSNGDGSTRGFCRCGRSRYDTIHTDQKETPSCCRLNKCAYNAIAPEENSQECFACPHLIDPNWDYKK
jgi:hypothetical protein